MSYIKPSVIEDYRIYMQSKILANPNITKRLVDMFVNKWEQIKTISEIISKKYIFCKNMNIRSLSQILSWVFQKKLWEDKYNAIKNLARSSLTRNDIKTILWYLQNDINTKREYIYTNWWFESKIKLDAFAKRTTDLKKQIKEKWYEYTLSLYS